MADQYDIVVVGGGIAGSALGIVMAQAGYKVKILERDKVYLDRVRGEFMVGWGVVEAKRLGLMQILSAGGGHFPHRVIPYDENLPAKLAEQQALDLPALAPDMPSPFCMGHPAMCETLNQAAQAAGADVTRGVKSIKLTPGERPEISYVLDGTEVTVQAKLVVGADGRNSVIRRQAGIEMQKDPAHNLLGGMLVEGQTSWRQDSVTLGTEGGIHFLIFPQGPDRLRLYICYDFADKERFTGPKREQNLLQAFRLKCLPQGEEISRCTPISPFHSYSNEDHWSDDPTAPGVVLIGDAASHCDPVTGQGLSVAMRDVRILRDILTAGDWSRAALQPYVDERKEYIRRIRVTARYVTKLRAEFGPAAAARRKRAQYRTNVEGAPTPSLSALFGPEFLPPICYEEAAIAALLAD